MKNIKKSYFIIFGLIVLAVVCFSTSYAIFSNTKEEHGKLNIVAGNLNYKIESSELDSDSITIPVNTSKEIRIKLTSLNEVSSKYELYYILDKTNDKVSVGYSKDTKDNVLGTIEGSSSKMITVVVRNDSDTSSKVTFKVLGGLVNNELDLKDGNSLNKELALCNYEKGYVWNFDYTGGEQEFTTPCSGEYKLETWGAQGGGDTTYVGGYGGYSVGNVSLVSAQNFYLNIGEKGKYCTGNECTTGNTYNGGGSCKSLDSYTSGAVSNCGSGGGATHIATKSGLLSTLENSKSNILIVAGGGGGANYCNGVNYASGGHGGGYIGVSAIDLGAIDFSLNGGLEASGGTQIDGYAFGQGSVYIENINANVGGGGGYFGGKSSTINGAGGGSGYIGNPLLTNKTMYCYNCKESTEKSTKTISTTCTSETPTENCSKQGNGYAKITLISY